MVNTKERSSQKEIMDDLEMQGEELEKTLQDLDTVNQWLGGNKITVDGVEKLLESSSYTKSVKIIDVGCGNGSVLKEVAKYGRKTGQKFELLGIDANKNAMEIAEKNLAAYPEVSFKGMDVFSEEFARQEADIILCTLTLHHFSDDEIRELMKLFSQKVGLGIVINDLKRSRRAYYLFQAFCAAFGIREINRKDGLTSILRSFKKEELQAFAKDLAVSRQEINEKWAFRYQWILYK
ncbi:methyltransferase domain-containing protein [Salinimicrobium sp. MT39]|uniref:Methyltransferase domain-containing protein n=1 Tax=Salinimicrobium profundisediminis TaxID=2994553 RepID=A0A9X3CX25_9FLAO|nr:methyltransferase domain-containing protein [Salinimicrobium profundisediminis]MCX2837060.1 methyltransferase domain-containing protein [Salinimicrobium profundisediminis]